MSDILFDTGKFMFSYRIAGVLIHNGKVLLQKPMDDDGYSLPGGHVSFGELSSETLVREFKEEIHADINVDRLIAISETFFKWGSKKCQQIGMYYLVSLNDQKQMQLDGVFKAYDELCGVRAELDFCWVPISELDKIIVYPDGIKEYIKIIPNGTEHFICIDY